MRKVHASTGCDACSVCARRNHKPRNEKSLRQLKWLSLWIGQSRLESATVTESFWKRREWNAVNPSSQQPKFRSGHGVHGNERSTLTATSSRLLVVDRWLSKEVVLVTSGTKHGLQKIAYRLRLRKFSQPHFLKCTIERSCKTVT